MTMVSASEGYHLFSTEDPFGELPRIGAIGHDRRAPGSYRSSTVNRPGAYAAVQIGLRGNGVLWPDPNNNSHFLPIPPDHALLFVVGEDQLSYGMPPGADQDWEFVYVNLEGAIARSTIHDIIARRGNLVRIHTLHAAVRELLHLAHLPGPLALRLSCETSCRLVGLLMSALVASPFGGDQALVRAAMAELDAFDAVNNGIAGIAERLGVSREHLTRIFTRFTGLPPARWQATQRLARAEHLLADPALTLMEVAAQAGFPSVAALSRCFRARHGYCPVRRRRTRSAPY